MENKDIIYEIEPNQQDFEMIKIIFEKYNAFYPSKTISLDILTKETIGKEYIVKEMIKKEYIRKYKSGYYYDKQMESNRFRLHLKIMRFMIVISFIVYAILIAGLIAGIIEGL